MLQTSGAVCHRSLVIVAGGFSVFAGVGERTREGNDLYKEMIESGVIKTGDKQVRSQEGWGSPASPAFSVFTTFPKTVKVECAVSVAIHVDLNPFCRTRIVS